MRRFGESRQHEAAKEKVANALRDKGFRVYIDSYPFSCQTEKGPRTYWPDVYAQNYSSLECRQGKIYKLDDTDGGSRVQSGGRRIIVEVQGFKGHKSKAAFQADGLRIADIRNSYGNDIEYYTVYLNKRIGPLDIRRWTMDDIVEHLGL
jgi:hypothetical protein